MWEVRVVQENGFTIFKFNEISDALNLTSICLECGDEGTNVTVCRTIEKEDE